jgi:hypothetical protein
MNAVPAAPGRCASCISVVVFPRPAGASRTMRGSARGRGRCPRVRSPQPIACHRHRWAPGEVDEWVSLRSDSPCPSNGCRGAFRAGNEVCDRRFDGDVEIEVAGAELGVLGHQQRGDDFLALDDVKFEPVVLSDRLFPRVRRVPSRCRFSGWPFGFLAPLTLASVLAYAVVDHRPRAAMLRRRTRRSVPQIKSSARVGWAEVLLNLCERDHHHHWINRTLVQSGTYIETLRVV